mgnify:CR=1 FL=1
MGFCNLIGGYVLPTLGIPLKLEQYYLLLLPLYLLQVRFAVQLTLHLSVGARGWCITIPLTFAVTGKVITAEQLYYLELVLLVCSQLCTPGSPHWCPSAQSLLRSRQPLHQDLKSVYPRTLVNLGSRYPMAALLLNSNPGGLLVPLLVFFCYQCNCWW